MVISSVESEESEPTNATSEPDEDIVYVCILRDGPTIEDVVAALDEEPPVPKRQPSRVWPPTRWGEWTYQPKEAVSLDDEEPEMAELVRRGGRKVG